MFCGLGFGLQALDVVITPCLHTYDMLCATHHFSDSTQCVAQSCNESITYEWMAAMGFGPQAIGPQATDMCFLKTQVLGSIFIYYFLNII